MKKLALMLIASGVLALQVALLGVLLTEPSSAMQVGAAPAGARALQTAEQDQGFTVTSPVSDRGIVGRLGQISPGAGERAQLAAIQQAVLTGSGAEAEREIARYNQAQYPGGSIHFYNAAPSSMGVAVRPSYYRGNDHFAVDFKVTAQERCRVIVPPGATVRAPGSGVQDVSTISYRVYQAAPERTAWGRQTIACAEFGKGDPREGAPRGMSAHRKASVAKVARAAARLGSSWRTAQVALWAVTDDPRPSAIAAAPGHYGRRNVREARQVVAAAGLAPENYRLWKKSGGFGLGDTLRRLDELLGG